MLLDKGYVNSYIVIDLRCSSSVPRTRQEDNLWHVSFSDDFTKATVGSADACYSNTLQLSRVETLHCFAAKYQVHLVQIPLPAEY